MAEPLVPGRCDSCGGPMPTEPDARVSRSRQNRICSRRCENREKHRREYRRYEPDLARQTECDRKERFRRRDLAERAIVRHDQQETLRAYECRWCGYWHLGGYGQRPEGG